MTIGPVMIALNLRRAVHSVAFFCVLAITGVSAQLSADEEQVDIENRRPSWCSSCG